MDYIGDATLIVILSYIMADLSLRKTSVKRSLIAIILVLVILHLLMTGG